MDGTFCSSPYGEELKCLISENDFSVEFISPGAESPAAECDKADF